MEAIANSKIYIPIFSKDYASRRWCLRELAKIIECWEHSQKQEEKKTIIPIFYDVDVTRDVRLNSKMYTTDLQKHKDVLGEDIVKPWEIALQKAAKISGFDARELRITKLMDLIVEQVCCKLWTRNDLERVPYDYVGINDPMEAIMKLAVLDDKDVRFVAIYGISGVGKTTLARLVFHKLSSSFRQGVAFLSDIREKSRKADTLDLQRDLISQLLPVKSFDIYDADQGANMIKENLKDKKVLIVLDDLDNREQLSKLAGHRSWFGQGSRIIVTTRNIGIMPNGEGFYQYEMQEMKPEDALKLFSRQVFESDLPPEEYDEISREVISRTGALPLTINVLAPLFRYNRKDAWEGTYNRKYAWGSTLEIPKKEVHKEQGSSSTGATTSRRPSSKDYEVFLNFRAPDSSYTVVDVFCRALVRAGVSVFHDDESIRKGKFIEGETKEAIINSKIYIPIFSRDYASSTWCLSELKEIMESWEASQKQVEKKTILPIFYDVHRSTDVKLKTEVYTTALRKHMDVLGEDHVKPWEIALQKAGKIKGWDIRDHGLSELSKLIVEEVYVKLCRRSDPKKVADDYVGIDNKMEDVMKLLDLHADDVRIIAIHGTCGVGKTTLVRLIFDKISSGFGQRVAFLPRVDKLFGIAGVDNDQRFNIIKDKFKDKKALIVLDDLDRSHQILELAGEPSWFGRGSRIIITTRNIGIIPEDNGFYRYKMLEMRPDDALKLFSKLVFKSDLPPQEFDEMSRVVVDTTGRLPLVINVIGSLFSYKSKDEWESILENLKKKIHMGVKEKLMICYRHLDYNEKEIFLDIVCLFINEKIEDVTYYWEAQGLNPIYGIMVLRDLSLIEIGDGNKLRMHDVLKDFGRNLVEDEKTDARGKHSRVWSPEIALNVIREEQGTEEVVALNLGELNADCTFSHKHFAGFKKLKFLELNGGNFENEDFQNVFSELRWLCWENCPAEFQAMNLGFENLEVLMLSGDYVTEDWGGWREIEAARNLRVLKCTNCRDLWLSPNFSAFPRLERLVFKDCEMLRAIHRSVCQLEHLTYLEITSCEHMRELPDDIGRLRSLSVLKLKYLYLRELPPSIGKLENLRYLCLRCVRLKELPNSVGDMKSLVELDISLTAITDLPATISHLENLKVFKCEDCHRLVEIPDKIKRLIPSPQFDLSSEEGIEISKYKNSGRYIFDRRAY